MIFALFFDYSGKIYQCQEFTKAKLQNMQRIIPSLISTLSKSNKMANIPPS